MLQESFIEKVLVVEDDRTVRDYLYDLLRIKGYKVKTVSSGGEALHLLSEEYFPVIITDLLLPDILGIEILSYLQKQDLHTAVLIITAHKSVDSVIDALRRGAYDYITKPFTSQVLLNRVARAMEKIRLEEMARGLSSKIIYTTEEERQRISREIHDAIGQALTIIKLTLKAIKNKYEHVRDLPGEIEGLAAYVEETMEEVSRISKDLSPSYVSEVGFPKALHLYIETFSKKTGIHVRSFFPEGLFFQSPQQETYLYRITQEALNNIAKHSGATEVEIHLTFMNNQILFSIADNGKGFNGAPEGQKGGLGLLGIRERIAALGGNICVESVPNQGTTIRMEVPYDSTKSFKS
ncbi:MAG: response regulator [Nitrospirae bacterium]|nr:response regulator [Nitrospirota bacterium]MBI5096365.1 response regulator [Nitrospirota bacterium]